MSEEILTLSDDNFDQEILANPGLALVDFWASWCAPCKMIAPTIEELAKEYHGKIKVGKVNVDEHQRTASRYGIRSIPTLLIFKAGKIVDQVIGAQSKAAIKKLLDKNA